LNICYEDIFKASYDEFLPQANLFINLTNDAWYDRSPAAHQHIQIAQARAMEFNRPIIRATNTGVTAYINNKGEIINSLFIEA
jgi:apolipoprotein N-acyltransferase